MNLKSGDTVMVVSGKDAGRESKIAHVYPDANKVLVEGVNTAKRHTKPTQKNPHGGIQDREGTVAIANVSLWCESCSAPRRAKKVLDDAKKKSRQCTKCGNSFPNPGM